MDKEKLTEEEKKKKQEEEQDNDVFETVGEVFCGICDVAGSLVSSLFE